MMDYDWVTLYGKNEPQIQGKLDVSPLLLAFFSTLSQVTSCSSSSSSIFGNKSNRLVAK